MYILVVHCTSFNNFSVEKSAYPPDLAEYVTSLGLACRLLWKTLSHEEWMMLGHTGMSWRVQTGEVACLVSPTTRPVRPLMWVLQASFCTSVFLAGLFQVLKASSLLLHCFSELCLPPRKAPPGQITSAFWETESGNTHEEKKG